VPAQPPIRKHSSALSPGSLSKHRQRKNRVKDIAVGNPKAAADLRTLVKGIEASGIITQLYKR